MFLRLARMASRGEIFISNIPPNFSPKDLSGIIPETSAYRISASFCYVTIQRNNLFEEIIQKLNEVEINGYKLKAKENSKQIFSRNEHKKKEEKVKSGAFKEKKYDRSSYAKKNDGNDIKNTSEFNKYGNKESEKIIDTEKMGKISKNKEKIDPIKLFERKSKKYFMPPQYIETYHIREDFKLKIVS